MLAKKSLGQHFLNSKHVLGQIITAANIQNDETILEIGPGTGILTEALLEAGANVIAIEKDSRSVELLNAKLSEKCISGKLKIISDDVLTWDPNKSGLADSKYSIVANIPYYITGAILEKFLEHEPRPKRMILLVQKEVADRIIARDGKESLLSISVKAFGIPRMIAKVPPGAFTPAPTVDSAILEISAISDYRFATDNIDIRHFFAIAHAGFAHKRKFLIRNLEDVMAKEKLETIWDKLGLDRKIRAEDIKTEDWINIHRESRDQ